LFALKLSYEPHLYIYIRRKNPKGLNPKAF
jgi:hypothetical protein